MNTWEASLKMVTTPAIIEYLLRGVLFTMIISLLAVVIGILLGSLLAMLRNYGVHGKARIFRRIAIIYIDKSASTSYNNFRMIKTLCFCKNVVTAAFYFCKNTPISYTYSFLCLDDSN